MAGLLYFLPGTTVKPRPDEIKALGLEFDHPPTPIECHGTGPSGGPGVTLVDPVRMGPWGLGVKPGQHWEEVFGVDGRVRYWVGWYKDAKPGPDDLKRDIQLPGPIVELADGKKWQVPRIQAWNEEDALHELALPCKRRRHPRGHWYRGGVVDEYQSLLQQGREFWEVLTAAAANVRDDGSFHYEWPPLCDFAATLLAINYALTLDDVSALGLFDGEARANDVALAAMEWYEYGDWLKKKAMELQLQESASGGSSPGPAESIESSDRVTSTTTL